MPQFINNVYDERAEVPSLSYIVGYISHTTFPICLDTGAGKSLMNGEMWRKINADDKYVLEPHYRGFQAINGSRINCQGSAVIQLMLLGEEKNYIGYFKFFIN